MLAKRLLLFVVILLVVTTLSAALAPPPRRPAQSGETAPASPRRTAPAAVVEHTIDAARRKPATVAVEAGDVLSLTVESDEAGAVELQGLAGLRAIAPLAPVVFDVLPAVPGDYPVVMLSDGRTLGTVRVTPREE